MSPVGPLPPFAESALAGVSAARRRAGPGQGSDGLRFAATALRCSVPAPSRNSLRSLRSLRSNSATSQITKRAARARPEPCAPRRPQLRAVALPGRLAGNASVARWPARHRGSCNGAPGRDRRASEAPSSAGFGARARSALRELTRRACSTAVSAANGGSCATGPRTRAAQGTRSAAKTASAKRWALPGCPVAAPSPAKRKFDDRNGPQAVRCMRWRFMCRGSRKVRWSNCDDGPKLASLTPPKWPWELGPLGSGPARPEICDDFHPR